MSKEQYVSFETAKLLKEKGFCEENVYCYYQGEYENDSTDVWRGECKFNWNIYNDSYSAPTQQMACRWLREEKKIHIQLEFCVDDDFSFSIFQIDGKRTFLYQEMRYWKKAEDAIEAGLKYCLENLV